LIICKKVPSSSFSASLTTTLAYVLFYAHRPIQALTKCARSPASHCSTLMVPSPKVCFAMAKDQLLDVRTNAKTLDPEAV
jgi:hypothetical protein